MEKITAILQGRVGSTRLPGKIMLPLQGKPMIQVVYDRLVSCECVGRVVVATTKLTEDDVVANHFLDQGIGVFRGSSDDPLDRYYQTAKALKITHILRAMADCPFIDPSVIGEVTFQYFSGNHDFCHLIGEFPTGLDTSIFSFECLEKTWKGAKKKSEREHITSYVTNNPTLFKIGTSELFHGCYHHRWVVDHPEDYEFAKAIYAGLTKYKNSFGWREIIAFLDDRPDILAINKSIKRDEGYLKSLTED